MKNPFWAKLELYKKNEYYTETIAEHTEKLIKELERLNHLYPNIPHLNWSLLKLACQYHDVGKTSVKFQNKLLKKAGKELLPDLLPNKQEVPHGYLSCAFFSNSCLSDRDDKRIVLQAIFYHHKRDLVEAEDIKEAIENDLFFSYELLQEHVNFSIANPKFAFLRYVNNRITKDDYPELLPAFIMVKGLLNRIDHAASAGIPVEIENFGLVQKLDHYFRETLKSESNELQNYMKVNKDKNNVVIASTGIGKTEGALYWLGNEKGFFTLPLRVSINSIYERIYNKINFKEVGLLHSETESEYISRDVFSIDYYEKTRQWSMPITVCTLDQILDFVFKEEGYEKKLATLAYSKIIIDEIQMYSPKMLACLLYGLKEITDLGGNFTIMTATFAPFIEDLMIKNLKLDFKKPENPFLKMEDGQVIKRHRLLLRNEQLEAKDILKNKEDNKILVIVNTVSKAQALFEEIIKDREDVYLFHSRFIKKDRRDKEAAIIKMGKSKTKEGGIWITTQVVEASVDIDFDVLYTELSDLNGLFQRMGRVYRNRTLEHERVNVYIYSGGDEYPTGITAQKSKGVVDIGIFKISKEALQPFTEPTLFSEELKMELIETNYTTEKLKGGDYYKDIVSYLHSLEVVVEYKESLISNLRDIFNKTIIPKSVYDKNFEKIEDIREKFNASLKNRNREEARMIRGRLRDEFLEFTVDVPIYRFENAKKLKRYEGEVSLGNYLRIPILDYEYYDKKGVQFTKEVKLFDKGQFI